jgi:protein-tyrosine phosphatase
LLWIDLEGAVNVRDVAGLPLTDGGVVAAGRLLRSDNLQDLTAADVARLVDDHGVRTVVDLRTDVEVALEGPGPLTRRDDVTIERRSLYPETGERTDIEADALTPWQEGVGGTLHPGEPFTVQTYMGYIQHRPDSITGALRTIAEPPAGDGGAVVVHCAAGKDRTGLVVALALEVAGVRREAIVDDYLATAERIDAIVARLAASPTYAPDMHIADPARHAPRPETMPRILALLDEHHGGPAAWLAHHGLTPQEQRALRERLTTP